jgi:hypothetical protein
MGECSVWPSQDTAGKERRERRREGRREAGKEEEV